MRRQAKSIEPHTDKTVNRLPEAEGRPDDQQLTPRAGAAALTQLPGREEVHAVIGKHVPATYRPAAAKHYLSPRETSEYLGLSLTATCEQLSDGGGLVTRGRATAARWPGCRRKEPPLARSDH